MISKYCARALNPDCAHGVEFIWFRTWALFPVPGCRRVRHNNRTIAVRPCRNRLQNGPLPRPSRAGAFIGDCRRSTPSVPSSSGARLGGFNAAGAELNVSANAVGRLVKLLEVWLGVALFRRLPRGVVVTEAGGRYLARVGTLLDQLAALTADLQRLETSRVLDGQRPAIDGVALAGSPPRSPDGAAS